MGKRVGIFGGSFDPIHFGHINLAIQLQEAHQLDEVGFFPAGQNPFKMKASLTDASHRLAMLRLALEGIPSFFIDERELRREGPTYTVDTIKSFHEDRPTDELFLILGLDTAFQFFSWHLPDEILDYSQVLIGKRICDPVNELDVIKDSKVLNALKKGFTETRILDISATEIRDRIRQNLYCGHLLPQKVLDYIKSAKLYL